MQRREFLKASALAGGVPAAGLAAPALAQERVRWRCASAFPPSAETLFGAITVMAEALAGASGGSFTLEIVEEEAAEGDNAPLEAVRSGQIDMLHTATHYYADLDPTFALGAGIPFGLNQRLADAWLMEGGGLDLFNAFLEGYGLLALPAGNTGAQSGGWFNREINALDDLEGLRFRIGGFGARIAAAIGMVPTDVAPQDLAAALREGRLDAAEFAGPAEDIALGLNRAARYLYYPGWWEGGITLMALVNRERFAALDDSRKAMLRQAAALANSRTMARYDVLNAGALGALVEGGTIIRPYSHDIMDAAFAAAENAYREIGIENERFAEIYESYAAFRRSGIAWFRRSEYAYNTFLTMLERGGRL